MNREADSSRLRPPYHCGFRGLFAALMVLCLLASAAHATEPLPDLLVTVQLDVSETNEALQLAPGEHRLASGKRIYKLESGQVLAKAAWRDAEAAPAPDCATLESLLASLDQPARVNSHRDDSLDVEGLPDAFKDLRIERDVHQDPRYACLLAKLEALPEERRCAVLTVVLEAAAASLESQFQVALAAARRVEPLVRSEQVTPQAFWLDDLTTTLTKQPVISQHPAAAFAFCMAVRLAGELHCTPLQDDIARFAKRATTERATLAALSDNPRLTVLVAAYSLPPDSVFQRALAQLSQGQE